MKKALLIAYYYPPLGGIGSQRPLKFARYLCQYGWQPIVLTVQPENSRAAFVDHSLDSGETQGIQVVRTPAVDLGAWFSRSGASSTQTTSQTTNQTPGSESTASNDINAQSTSQRIRATLQQTARTWAYIPDAQNGWYPSAVAAGKQILRDHDIDVIYSTSYPVTAHFVAQRLKAFSNKPWVADFRDLWSEVHMEGAYASRWRKRLDQRLEARLLNKVDTIITVSDTLATALQRLSGQRKRVEVIRNGFDAADFIDLPHQVSEQWTITFVGTFYSFYNPAPFLAALQRLIHNGSIPREKARFQI
jgi:glycosyltransferase involved in cell wall biosynthesis